MLNRDNLPTQYVRDEPRFCRWCDKPIEGKNSTYCNRECMAKQERASAIAAGHRRKLIRQTEVRP